MPEVDLTTSHHPLISVFDRESFSIIALPFSVVSKQSTASCVLLIIGCCFFRRASGLGWCLPIIGLSSLSQIIGQSWNTTGSPAAIIGPVVPLAIWTHIVTSYSATNGVRLWFDGTLIGSTGPFAYAPSTVPNTITLGNSVSGPGPCASGSIAKGQFYGMMDELRVYSRELNASEVSTLANP